METLPKHPLDKPGIQRVVVSEDVAEVLESIGDHLFVIATRADSTAPKDVRGRMLLLCQPCTKDTLDAAYRVLSGTHKATLIKAPK